MSKTTKILWVVAIGIVLYFVYTKFFKKPSLTTPVGTVNPNPSVGMADQQTVGVYTQG